MARGKATPLIKDGIDYRRSRTCVICSQEYNKPILVNEKQWSKSKYCSISCKFKGQIGKLHPNNRRKMTQKEKDIRNEKMASKYGWNKGKKRTMEARIKMSATRQGIAREQWDGFVRNADKLERTRFRHQIQKKVFERDNYVCQVCFIRGGALQVDHIQPWSEYVEGRFDINNCRTLCMSCHYKITFGHEKPKDVTTWGHNYFRSGDNL